MEVPGDMLKRYPKLKRMLNVTEGHKFNPFKTPLRPIFAFLKKKFERDHRGLEFQDWTIERLEKKVGKLKRIMSTEHSVHEPREYTELPVQGLTELEKKALEMSTNCLFVKVEAIKMLEKDADNLLEEMNIITFK